MKTVAGRKAAFSRLVGLTPTVKFPSEEGRRISSIRALPTMSNAFPDFKGSQQPTNTKPMGKGLANLFFLCPWMELTRKLSKCVFLSAV